MRRQMTQFWSRHAKAATVVEMMLDAGAETLSSQEQPEIVSLLPPVKGKKVLELGAGIGRFTGALAEEAHHVTAVDFMEKFIKKNRETHGNKSNIKFIQADVMKLDLPPKSFDVIFSNWLMMYLTDEEVLQLAAKTLSWLTNDGFLFFREPSHGPQGIDMKPTFYRNPAFYDAVHQCVASNNAGDGFGFELKFRKSIKSYIKLRGRHDQFCWLMQKTKLDTVGLETVQQFLDNQQYAQRYTQLREMVSTDGHITVGGLKTTMELVDKLNLKPGQRILDVGSRTGAGVFYMAETYDVDVTGIDLSICMNEFAMETSRRYRDLEVQFEVADVTKHDYKPESFDVIYSRDTILHIADKKALFTKFLTWLKPGGKLLISDYCCGELPHTETFKMYVAQRGYTLYTPEQYGKLLEEAGFINVKVEDRTLQFTELLEEEKVSVESRKKELIKEFSEDNFNSLMDGWTTKLTQTKTEDLKWGMFLAEKVVA